MAVLMCSSCGKRLVDRRCPSCYERLKAARDLIRNKNKRPLSPEEKERRCTAMAKGYRRKHKEFAYACDKIKASSISKKIRGRISSGMWHSIKGLKAGQSWETLVGYTLDELIAHLEALFVPGMSWKNTGEWHIDHIIPVSSFDIKSLDSVDFKVCWGLSNLQPLWAHENLSKGAKLDWKRNSCYSDKKIT